MSSTQRTHTLQQHAARSMMIFSVLSVLILVAARIQPVTADDTPTLQFSTYLGGSNTEYGEDVTVDRDGNIYVTGSGSADFPATNALGVSGPGIYVTKFDRAGTTQLYSVFVGGGKANGIAVDADGYAYVVGDGAIIPTVNAIQPTHPGGQDGFVAKINPSGTALVYATYLGGSSDDVALSVALDANQNVYVVGSTTSSNFPTHNAYQDTHTGTDWDAFLVRINSAGTAFDYATYFGGNDHDIGLDLALDNAGNAYITGETGSDNFPTMNAYQSQRDPGCLHGSGTFCSDAFVAKFNPSGVPVYSTYLGGNGSRDRGYGIAVDGLGSAYVTGETGSTNFPVTANAFQTTAPLNVAPAFLTKFMPDGSNLVYSTYLSGTTDGSIGIGIDVNSEGQAFVAGATWATDFPTVNPIQATKGGTAGTTDAFVAQFSADGSTLEFSTYFGGSNEEYVEFSPRLALNPSDSVIITGTTLSNDLPILHAFQSTPGGAPPMFGLPNFDAFVAKISFPLLSEPAEATGRNYYTTHTPTLTWTPMTGVIHYRVQVSKNKLFTGTPAFDHVTEANEFSILTTHLDDGLYYWHVQAQKANGEWGNFGPVDSFVIYVD